MTTLNNLHEKANELKKWWGISNLMQGWDINEKTNDPTTIDEMTTRKSIMHCAGMLDTMIEDIQEFQEMLKEYAKTVEQ